jgi:predicted Zn finger-like uncharacterized protein
MLITCPHCQYAKDVNEAWIPAGDSQVECPECQESFYFSHSQGVSMSPPVPQVENISCPACAVEQPKGDHCTNCGIVYAKWQKRQQAAEGSDDEFGFEKEVAATFSVHRADKGGFWIRVGASFVDSLVLMVLLGLPFYFIIVEEFMGMYVTMTQMQMGGFPSDDPAYMQQFMAESMALQQRMMMYSALLNLVAILYYVVPTAITGKTLGKKVCGIRVVSEREKVGFLRAILRETVGKWISAIIFGIGFLMVAFQKEKRGLHDMIAGTWVIRD